MTDTRAPTGEFVVFLVDDDNSVIRATSRLLSSKGYTVRSFLSGTEFLAAHDPAIPGCAILDVTLPDLNGLELQERLAADEAGRPIIFLTGTGDIPASVQAMKAGAIDFLTKPVRSADLLAAIEAAREKSERFREQQSEVRSIAARFARLTPREQQVLWCVVRGRLNKQTAGELGISIKTVKLHRGRAMQKMKVRTVAELVHLVEVAGLLEAQRPLPYHGAPHPAATDQMSGYRGQQIREGKQAHRVRSLAGPRSNSTRLPPSR
jgi:FixJ family two-component response regulator